MAPTLSASEESEGGGERHKEEEGEAKISGDRRRTGRTAAADIAGRMRRLTGEWDMERGGEVERR